MYGDFIANLMKITFWCITALLLLSIAFNGGRLTEKQAAVDAGVARWTINEKGEKGFEYIKNAGGECELQFLEQKGRD